MGSAAPQVQWAVNGAHAGIGIHFPEHHKRALAIGEVLFDGKARPSHALSGLVRCTAHGALEWSPSPRLLQGRVDSHEGVAASGTPWSDSRAVTCGCVLR